MIPSLFFGILRDSGDSVRLAERLKARSNPIGWFTSEIWDRLTDKSLWLNQQAIKHVRDKSLVILYLVNASESPEAVPYVKAEMDILAWVNKPVIVLLNQMGEARPPEEEKAEVELWRDYLKPYAFVKAVMPMDAFARCWVQEYEFWKEIELCLTDADKPTFASLHATWIRQKQALYSSSLEAMAAYMVKVSNDKEVLASQSLIERLRSIGRSLGFIKKDLHGAMEDAQVALSTRAADWLCTLTQRLININGLEGSGTKAEILRRMRSDWETQATIDPKAASLLGAVAGGAVSGIAADIATGGATLGLGALGGAIVGALAAPVQLLPTTFKKAIRKISLHGLRLRWKVSCWIPFFCIWLLRTSGAAEANGKTANLRHFGKRWPNRRLKLKTSISRL